MAACVFCKTGAVATLRLRASTRHGGVGVGMCTRHLLGVLAGQRQAAPCMFMIVEMTGPRG